MTQSSRLSPACARPISGAGSGAKMARGRKPGFVMSDEHRVKIQNSNILNALIEHCTGQREMSATQVSAGLGLLKKVMPDMASVEHSGEIATRHEDALDELDDRPRAGNQEASEEQAG